MRAPWNLEVELASPMPCEGALRTRSGFKIVETVYISEKYIMKP
jgi:hypothetical protein